MKLYKTNFKFYFDMGLFKPIVFSCIYRNFDSLVLLHKVLYLFICVINQSFYKYKRKQLP